MGPLVIFLFGVILLQQAVALPKLSPERSIYPTSSRLVGGSPADDDEFPFVASLQLVSIWSYHFCGATVVNQRTFLTAAHCIEPLLVNHGELYSNVFALYGPSDNNWVTGDMEFAPLIDYAIHPNWDRNSVKNDLGLVFGAPEDYNIPTFFVQLHDAAVGGDMALVIAGWGATSITGAVQAKLRKVETSSLSHSQCVESRDLAAEQWSESLGEIPSVIEEVEICTERPSVSICYGDSGSPLLIPGTNRQVGLSSWAIPCGLKGPNVFTRLESFVPWINNVLSTRAV